MSRFLIVVLSVVLISCGGSGSSDSGDTPEEIRDLSGTWLYRTTTDSYWLSNGTFYFSEYLDRIMIIDDSEDRSIQIFECVDYPSSPIQGVDLDGNLQITMPSGKIHNYIKIGEDDYEYTDPNRELLQSSPSYEFENTYRLKKISDSKNIDYGMLSIQGSNNSLNVDEDAQVCAQSAVGSLDKLVLQVPYDDSYVELGLEFLNQPTVGTYFHSGALTNPFYFFRISSSSSLFQQEVGNRRIDTVTSEIKIDTSDDQVFAGTFSVDNGTGVEYTGEFYIQKLPNIP